MVKSIVQDIEDATDAIMDILDILDILDQSYEKTDGMLEVMGWETSFEDYIAHPFIEVNTDWFLPLCDGDYWENTTDLLEEIGACEALIDDYKHRLVIEAMGFIEEAGRNDPESDLVDIFGEKALDGLRKLEETRKEFDQNKLIATSAPLIADWIGRTIEQKGEAVSLYAALKLVTRDQD